MGTLFCSLYRIAGLFRGRKFSQISWICSYSRIFCMCAPCPLALVRGVANVKAIAQSAKNLFVKYTNASHSRKFSPVK